MNQEQKIAEVLAETLTAHQRQNASHCLCGWSKLGASHPAHQAAVLAPLITAAKAEAFEQGQKSGMRHADRLIAAAKIGRPDLPGPISPNPYRTEAQ